MHKFRSLPLLAAFALSGLVVSAPALAHPKLVSSTPAKDATASGVKSVSITFSEALMEKLSGIDLTMTGMPGVTDHPPMKIARMKVALGADQKTLTATLPRALVAGTYDVDWHAVSVDTHKTAGKFTFTVK